MSFWRCCIPQNNKTNNVGILSDKKHHGKSLLNEEKCEQKDRECQVDESLLSETCAESGKNNQGNTLLNLFPPNKAENQNAKPSHRAIYGVSQTENSDLLYTDLTNYKNDYRNIYGGKPEENENNLKPSYSNVYGNQSEILSADNSQPAFNKPSHRAIYGQSDTNNSKSYSNADQYSTDQEDVLINPDNITINNNLSDSPRRQKPSHRTLYGGSIPKESQKLTEKQTDHSQKSKPSHRDLYGVTDDCVKPKTSYSKPFSQKEVTAEHSESVILDKPNHRNIYLADNYSYEKTDNGFKNTNNSNDDNLYVVSKSKSSLNGVLITREKTEKKQVQTIDKTETAEVYLNSSTDGLSSYYKAVNNQPLVSNQNHPVLYDERKPQITESLNKQLDTVDNKHAETNLARKPSYKGIYGGENNCSELTVPDRSSYIGKFFHISDNRSQQQIDIQPLNYTFEPRTPKTSHRNLYLHNTDLSENTQNRLTSNSEGTVTERRLTITSRDSTVTERQVTFTKDTTSTITGKKSVNLSNIPQKTMDKDWNSPRDISNKSIHRPMPINEGGGNQMNDYMRDMCKINQHDDIRASTLERLIQGRNKEPSDIGSNFEYYGTCAPGNPATSSQYVTTLPLLNRPRIDVNPATVYIPQDSASYDVTSKEVEDGTKVFTLLQSACKGDINTLKRHYHDGTDMSIADYDGRRALHLAAAEGHLNCVQFLIETCQVPHSPRDRWFHTPLDEAKSFRQEAVIKYLEEYVRKAEEQERGAKTYLLLNSACKGDLRMLKRLFQDGVDMRIADYDGRTALHLAAAEGKLDCVKFLIENCEVQHSPKDRWYQTPFDEAKTAKHQPVMEYLEDWIARANEKNAGAEVYSVLNSACRGDLVSLQKMAHDGMDMETADYDGRTALHLAAAEGHAEVVKFLVEKCKVGTDPKDRWQHTPLDEAKNNNNDSVIQYLGRCVKNSNKLLPKK